MSDALSNATPEAASIIEPAPAHLSVAALARRLVELAGDERAVQVAFLRHLGEFDRREAWLVAGYPSLWAWCRQVLHLREGAAWRRIAAMRALRQLPQLAPALADGRLCLTTLALLDPVLTEANAGELVAQAAFKSKAEVEALVVALKPRHAPQDGVRRLPRPGPSQTAAGSEELGADQPAAGEQEHPRSGSSGATLLQSPSPLPAQPVGERVGVRGPSLDLPAPAPPTRPTIQPVAAETFSLRVTIGAALKRDLDRLTELLSHKVPTGDLAAVLREAIACAVEKHGTRRGAVAPKRKAPKTARPKAPSPAAAPASPSKPRREPIPAELRRQVHERDGGRCAWVGPDGHRCESRWQLEVDHVVAVALGGRSDLTNLRLACKGHNRLHAERTLGRGAMRRFRGGAARAGEPTSPGGSGRTVEPPS